jgi:transcription elongation factor Elf1
MVNDDDESKEADQMVNDDDEDDNKSFRCAICNACLKSRSTLTSHYNRHKKKNQFERRFQCPECRRNKVSTFIEKGFVTWLKHLDSFHGKRYTLYFQQNEPGAEVYPCALLMCNAVRNGKRYNSKGLSIHFSRTHVKELDATKTTLRVAVQCYRCISQGVEENIAPLIEGIQEWRSHCDLVHGSEK